MVIVGLGALGTWLAVRLARSGNERIVLVARHEQAATVSREGLHLEVLPAAMSRSAADDVSAPPAPLHWHVPPDRFDVRVAPEERASSAGLVEPAHDGDRSGHRDAPNANSAHTALDHHAGDGAEHGLGDLDDALLFITTRAYQTQAGAQATRQLGVRPRYVVTLQNGLGNAEVLAETFGGSRVIAGTTTHGVTALGAGRARHAGRGRTVIGAWSTDPSAEMADAVHDVAARLTGAGIMTEMTHDPRQAIWEKVVVNAAINPLTAIHGIPNGTLLERKELTDLMERACREAAQVARAEGLDLDEARSVEAARRVARETAQNESSMLQAKRAGRRLEADAITGEIVRRAQRHGIPTPINARLLAALVGWEHQRMRSA